MKVLWSLEGPFIIGKTNAVANIQSQKCTFLLQYKIRMELALEIIKYLLSFTEAMFLA